MRARPWVRGVVVGVLAVGAGASVPLSSTSAAVPVPGSAGTDTSLPLTDSAVTVHGRGPFEQLEITVNQTANLGNQAVSITWSGAEPTIRAGGADFAANFLQIMQCWTEPEASSPVPEQCEFGATDGVFGGRNGTLFAAGGFADDRVIARGDFESFDPSDGVFEGETNWLWQPFRSVTGETVGAHVDTTFSPAVGSGDYWLNPFFNVITTNEIVGGRTRSDGSGEELLEVVTGVESSGLGCGQAVIPLDDGGRAIPRCWLVVVPRGEPTSENEGTIAGSIWEGSPGVMTSPLAPSAWANRIAIPLDFNPVDTPCDLNDDQRRIVGSELLLRAVGSWQPALCSTPGLPPFGYASVGDANARFQLVSGAQGAPGMAVTSRPLAATPARATNPVTYAPLTLSALVIAFNIERVPDVETAGPESEQLRGTRIETLNLTPRLVAKLLTQSYQGQVSIANEAPPSGYGWAEDNPAHLDRDPDFLRFNPEFGLLVPGSAKNFGGLVLAAGTSDAARQIWQWILADPEARAWLDGEPDEWGMLVNPVYATTAEANSSGLAFGDPAPETLPKSDPHCFQATSQGPGGRVVPPALCGTDWLPYAQSLRDAAQRTRAANDGARTNRDTEATSADRVWRPDGPQPLGTRTILSVVDSPTAVQYGLQTARLSRAGDGGDDRAFITADSAGMTAGVEAMVASSDDPAVLVPDPTVESSTAYPLTALTYAGVAPLALDAPARTEYAAFVDYAVGAGQDAGLEIGQLPPGYTELPASLVAQATAAAVTIRTLVPAVVPTTPATTAPTTPAVHSSIGQSASSSSSSSGATSAAVTPTGDPAITPASDEAAVPVTTVSSGGMTPISSSGNARFALPIIGVFALLSTLGALEITKRPRRAPTSTGATTLGAALVGAVVAAAIAVLATALPATALPATGVQAAAQQLDGGPLDAGDLTIVDRGGDRLEGGGSATQFTLELTGPAECPGDSANDNYRVYSFMVPIAVAAEDVTFDGLGPTPQVFERYDDFQMPLYDINTRDYSGALTALQDAPGQPGAIVDIPPLSFAVYRADEMQLGEYRVGLACTRQNEIERYWDTAIVVAADGADPAGFAWRVVGVSASADGSGLSGGLIVGLITAGALATLLLIRRFRSHSRSRPTVEAR